MLNIFANWFDNNFNAIDDKEGDNMVDIDRYVNTKKETKNDANYLENNNNKDDCIAKIRKKRNTK